VPLSLTTHWSADIPVVVCRGRIVEGTESATLREHLDKELAQQSLLVLDLREVDFIDSSGLGLLVRYAMHLRKEGGELKLCNVSPRIHTTLKTTKVNTVLKSYASENEALSAFAPALQAKKTAAAKTDVLCVTSSADLLAYLGQLLHQAGYAVSTTDNLPEAEAMLAAKPKFLVIDAYFSATVSGDPALRDRFNALIDGVSIVELPPDFASSDAGDAARQLVKHLRAALSGSQSGTPSNV
jgi:anti-anti-sigma factor